jgi:hypothetical protein
MNTLIESLLQLIKEKTAELEKLNKALAILTPVKTRGRPKKVVQVKRGRGRPRKHATPFNR